MKSGKRWLWAFGAFSVLYLVLLIPDSKSNVELRGANTAFRWNEDPTWYKLENKFSSLRNSCEIIQPAIAMSLNQLRPDVNRIDTDTLSHDDAALKVIRRQIFEIAAMISACPDSALPFIQLTSDLRVKIKTASIHCNNEHKSAR